MSWEMQLGGYGYQEEVKRVQYRQRAARTLAAVSISGSPL